MEPLLDQMRHEAAHCETQHDLPDVAAVLRAGAVEIERLRTALDEMCVIAKYSGTDGRRDWVSAGSWLYPGDVIAVISQPNATLTAPTEAQRSNDEH